MLRMAYSLSAFPTRILMIINTRRIAKCFVTTLVENSLVAKCMQQTLKNKDKKSQYIADKSVLIECFPKFPF